MRLSKDQLVVSVEDAKFFFDIPSRKKFFEAASANSYEELVASTLRRVEGVEDEDGKAVDGVQVLELPVHIFKKLYAGWIAEITKLLGVSSEAEQKNAIG